MALGNYEITEKCYQMNRQFDKLNFFYATTGSISKLNKMQGVATSLGDPMLRYNTATLTANVTEKVKILAENGQIPLAYITAKSHGLDEFATTLEQSLIESEEYDHERIFREADVFISKQANRSKAILPLRPVFTKNEELSHSNWPMVNLRAQEAERAAEMFRQKQKDLAASPDMFFDAKEYQNNMPGTAAVGEGEVKEGEAAAWGDDEEIDMGIELEEEAPAETKQADDFTDDIGADMFEQPGKGLNPVQRAVKKNPQNVGYNVAAGEFEKAHELLKKQLGIADYSSFNQLFEDIHQHANQKMKAFEENKEPINFMDGRVEEPVQAVSMQTLQKLYLNGVESTTKGDFNGALGQFRQSLQSVPLLSVQTEQDLENVHELIKKLTEYISALRIEIERKKMIAAQSTDQIRMLELSCYMTLCGMD